MSNELTIEELKALKEDDWIYIKDLEFGNDFYAAVTDTYLGESAKYINIAAAGWYQEFWFEAYSTEWLAYRNKEEAEGEYDSLAVELEAVKQDKANLERTIDEMNEALKTNGITIDCDGNVIDERAEAAANEYVTVLNNNTILAEKLGEVEQENIRLWKLIKDHDKSVDEAKKQVAKEILQKTRELHDSPEYDARDGYDCNALVAYDKVMYFIKRKYNVEVDE